MVGLDLLQLPCNLQNFVRILAERTGELLAQLLFHLEILLVNIPEDVLSELCNGLVVGIKAADVVVDMN